MNNESSGDEFLGGSASVYVQVCTCVRTGSRGEARGGQRRAQPAARNGWIKRNERR